MSIPVTDPRHPLYKFSTAIVPGAFAEKHARNPRICADCGLLGRHRDGCPSA